MAERLFSIREIAEKNGLSAKTIQRIIKEHPEFGITMEPKTKTMLTFDQAAKVSAVAASRKLKMSQVEENKPGIRENCDFEVKTESVADTKMSQVEDSETVLRQIEELQKQVLELTERAARAEGRAEALESQVSDLKAQRDEAAEDRRTMQADLAGARLLLEDAEAKAARAQAEADSFSPSIFGFYRKNRKSLN